MTLGGFNKLTKPIFAENTTIRLAAADEAVSNLPSSFDRTNEIVVLGELKVAF